MKIKKMVATIIVLMVSSLGLFMYFTGMDINNGELPGEVEKADEISLEKSREVLKKNNEDNKRIKKLDNITGLEMDHFDSLANFRVPYPSKFILKMLDNNHVVIIGAGLTINVLSEPTYKYENHSANSLAAYFNNFSSSIVYVDQEGVYHPAGNISVDNGINNKSISDFAVVSGERSGATFISPNTLTKEFGVECSFATIDNLPIAIYIVYEQGYNELSKELSRYMISNIDIISNLGKEDIFDSEEVNVTIGESDASFLLPKGFSRINVDNDDMVNSSKRSGIVGFEIFKYNTNNESKLSDLGVAAFFLEDSAIQEEYFLEDVLGKMNGFLIDSSYKYINEFEYLGYSDPHPFEVYDKMEVKQLQISGRNACNYELNFAIKGGFKEVIGNERKYFLHNNVVVIPEDGGYLYIFIKGDMQMQEDLIKDVADLILKSLQLS